MYANEDNLLTCIGGLFPPYKYSILSTSGGVEGALTETPGDSWDGDISLKEVKWDTEKQEC